MQKYYVSINPCSSNNKNFYPFLHLTRKDGPTLKNSNFPPWLATWLYAAWRGKEDQYLPTSLAYRRIRGDMIQTFKLLKGMENCPIENFLNFAHYNKRGYTLKLEKPSCSTSFTLTQFSHRVFNMWKSLPQKVVDAGTVNAFKARLDKHWHGNTIYEY